MKLPYKLFTACLFSLSLWGISASATSVTIMVGGSNGMSFVPSSGITINVGDTIKWVWDNGSHTTTSTTIPVGAASWDEPINSRSTSFIYVPTIAGVYNYKCIPHEAMGMIGSFTVNCVAPSNPVISPAGPVTACEGDSSALLMVTASPGVDFQWNFNGNPISGADQKQLLPDSSGVYSCTVTNDCGTATSNTVTITLKPAPIPSFTYTHTDMTYTFTNTTEDTALSWSWDFGDGTTSMEQSPQHQYTLAGSYTVVLTATDTAGNGCSGQATQEIDAGNTGIGKIASGEMDLLSPNPATTYINIPVKDADVIIQIYDISGRLMQEPYMSNRSPSLLRLNISMLSPGSYFLRMITKENSITQKFIVKR